ncbi:hypothetical protein NDU88_004384 [Pleurodeles waltl]|uniref:Uncharacterized protein n=1 Tax=Pleurodeles waltl TaxID=8319 RepID=A0AAV7SIL5_PLEWA|nr:hypothetical protein NDU88_004384 [Pleurodeles waltl]
MVAGHAVSLCSIKGTYLPSKGPDLRTEKTWLLQSDGVREAEDPHGPRRGTLGAGRSLTTVAGCASDDSALQALKEQGTCSGWIFQGLSWTWMDPTAFCPMFTLLATAVPTFIVVDISNLATISLLFNVYSSFKFMRGKKGERFKHDAIHLSTERP